MVVSVRVTVISGKHPDPFHSDPLGHIKHFPPCSKYPLGQIVIPSLTKAGLVSIGYSISLGFLKKQK